MREPTPDLGYPDDELDLPPRRGRTALIAVAVLCVIAAGVALGLLIGNRDSGEEGSGLSIAASPEVLPSFELPPGCELLTPGQVTTLVPGELTRAGRGPEVVLDATESACDWTNTETYPADPLVQAADLKVRAAAAPDEEAARAAMEQSLPCQGPRSKKITVTGADEACLSHKPSEKQRGTEAEVALVSARYYTLVVEVSYERANWPAWRIDDQTAVTAGALIGRVLRQQ